MRLWCSIWLTGIAFSFGAGRCPVMAGEPTEGIKDTTAKILDVLKNPDLKGPEKTVERRRRIREAADERFDWPEISRRCLATNWQALKEKQQKEFVDLFVRFVEVSYMGNLETHYTDLKEVHYRNEETKGKFAAVATVIETTKDTKHPVEFRLKMRDGWKIYDMLIEGVSMVKNYQTQFDEIIQKSGYDGLVKALEEKIEKGQKEPSEGESSDGGRSQDKGEMAPGLLAGFGSAAGGLPGDLAL
jgi:phospholipid transport system substrate-binding protein